ncbi:MLO-like protein 6 [Rhodamnia argentea]|uniref:MLO-like protein 6 n=1 Tax=Rhodamnia argentea TaxID=178133 RepID=A0ABM3HND3_9MYRT|nr:MLO-like protein 6 [Rhodamnia argentea]
MIQNSFQLAFFAWTWYEFGLRSCFNQETQDIAMRISIGVAAQILCGYVTFIPLRSRLADGLRDDKGGVFGPRGGRSQEMARGCETQAFKEQIDFNHNLFKAIFS